MSWWCVAYKNDNSGFYTFCRPKDLCRTGHDDVSLTGMTTLAFILFFSYFPLVVSDAISCPLHNLKTVWNIIMILHSYVEQVMTIWQLSFLYFLSYLPLMVKATKPYILNNVRNIFMRLYGSVEEVVAMCLVYKIWRVLCSYPPPPPMPPTSKKLRGHIGLGLYVHLSVRPSVYLSVTLFGSWLTQEQLMLKSWNFICGMYMKNKRTHIFIPSPVLSFLSYGPFWVLELWPFFDYVSTTLWTEYLKNH